MIYYECTSEVRIKKTIRFVKIMLYKIDILRLVNKVYHNYEVYSMQF